MKILPWIVLTFLLTVAAMTTSFFTCTRMQATDELPSANERESKDDGTAGLELCKRGLVLLEQDRDASAGSRDAVDKGGAMVQNAWNLQARCPAISPKIWRMTKTWAANLPSERRYLTLALFLQSVNDAIDLCEQPSDFDLLWQVRKEVVSEIAAVEAERTHKLSGNLEKLIEEIDDRGVEQCLLSPNQSEETNAVRSGLETLRETSDELPPVISGQVETIKNKVSTWFDGQVNDIDKQYSREKERDVTVDKSIDPVSHDDTEEPAKGEYALLLDSIENVWKTRMSPEMEFWMQFPSNTEAGATDGLAPKDAKETSPSMEERLQNLRLAIIRSVRIRYNIWAAKQIYLAGELKGPRGCVALGRIDNGLLNPAVNALYSTAESQVFQSIDDPHQRHVQVRKMLATEPVGLDSF